MTKIFWQKQRGKSIYVRFYFNFGLIDIYSQKEILGSKKYLQRLIKSRHYRNLGRFREPEVHPSTILHGNGKTATKFTIFWNGLGEIGQRKVLQKLHPNARPFILMRAGYSGAQRNGLVLGVAMFLEVGGGLQSQSSTLFLQMGLQGIAFLCTVIWEVLPGK